MFNISENKIKGPIYNAPVKYYTEDEIREKLINYIEVPKTLYETIRPGSHVRYIKIDGAFRCGGFVTKNPIVSTKNEDTTSYFMCLRSDIRAKANTQFQWVVNYSNIDKLYVKISIEHDLFRNEMHTRLDNIILAMNRNFEKIKRKIREIESGDTMSVSGISTRSSIHPVCADVESGLVGSARLTKSALNQLVTNSK